MLEVLLDQLRIARLAEEPRRHPVPEVVDPKVRHARSLQGRPVRTPDPRCGDGDAIALLELAGLASSCDCRHAGGVRAPWRLAAAASTMAADAVTTSSFVAWSLADLTWQSYPASRRGALAGMLPVRTVKLAARLVAVEYRGGTFRCFVEKDAFSALPPPAPSQIFIRNQRKPFNPLFPHVH
jgi:hypothetical protein